MEQINLLSQSSTIILIVFIGLIFLIIGITYSKKYQSTNNYLVANRTVGTFSLTTSLVASALGAWILFGPASAATWGGIGAVIGEWVGSSEGLGYLMIRSKPQFHTELVFAAIFILSAIGIGLFLLVGFLERLVIPWSRYENSTK